VFDETIRVFVREGMLDVCLPPDSNFVPRCFILFTDILVRQPSSDAPVMDALHGEKHQCANNTSAVDVCKTDLHGKEGVHDEVRVLLQAGEHHHAEHGEGSHPALRYVPPPVVITPTHARTHMQRIHRC
jgi:hypothetical protein